MVFTLLLGAAPLAAARPVPEYDTQWWQELDLAESIGTQWSYLIAGFTRFSNNDPNPALAGGGTFGTYTQGTFSYTFGYLHAQVRSPSSGNPLDANIPVVATTGTLHWGLVTVSNRLRIEDLIGVPGDPWRYRNLVFVGLQPRGWMIVKSWGVSDEVFIDIASGRFSRNRLLAGPVLSVSRHIDLSLDYLDERDVRGIPRRVKGAFLDVTLRL